MRDGDNIREVESLHPDMMGFICWESSKRAVHEVPSYLPQCERVGVFVNPSIKYVVEMVDKLKLNRIQLHGYESQMFCRQVHEATGLPITKAISVADEVDLERYHEYAWEPSVDLFLFDTKSPSVGGSGENFDWDVLYRYMGHKPFLLAGGIGPHNIDKIQNFSHPKMLGIDLNSCFETAPGMKNVSQLKTFIERIKS